MRKAWLLAAATVIAAVAWALHPVCVPLSAEDLQGFNVPIEQRTDRDLYLKVFQRRGGRWYQCKTWISRQFCF